MLRRPLLATLLLILLPAVPAGADERMLVPGAEARALSAAAGNLVWVDAEGRLMRRTPGGRVAPVPGAPAGTYRSIDLGLTRSGRLVLTYLRCTRSGSRCRALADDLAGRRTAYRRLAPRRCTLSTAPARWRGRVAYGLDCDRLRGRPGVHDARRSGLFVRSGARPARRLRLPRDPGRGVSLSTELIDRVDLVGTRVAAVGGDIVRTGFTQTVNGSGLRSALVAASEGSTSEGVRGLALGAGGVAWALVQSVSEDGPNEVRVQRLDPAGCVELEVEPTPAGAGEEEGREYEEFTASALAVDGGRVILARPGVGIVEHDFVPRRACDLAAG